MEALAHYFMDPEDRLARCLARCLPAKTNDHERATETSKQAGPAEDVHERSGPVAEPARSAAHDGKTVLVFVSMSGIIMATRSLAAAAAVIAIAVACIVVNRVLPVRQQQRQQQRPQTDLQDGLFSVDLEPTTSERRVELDALRKHVCEALEPAVVESSNAQLQLDAWCGRFLAAADWQATAAARQVADTLRWRHYRRPIPPLCTASVEDVTVLYAACASGSIVCPGKDAHGRAVVCIDNSAAPVTDFEAQVRLLTYTIELALRQCVHPANKICFVFKLGRFSTENQVRGPPRPQQAAAQRLRDRTIRSTVTSVPNRPRGVHSPAALAALARTGSA